MTIPIDLTNLEARTGLQVTLVKNQYVNEDGSSEPYSGFAAAGKVTVVAGVAFVSGDDNQLLEVVVEGSPDGVTWTPVEGAGWSFDGQGEDTVDVDSVPDQLRVNWTVAGGLREAVIGSVTVLLNSIGGGGGGAPAWLQSGSGSPLGAVTPEQTGALYQDTTNGQLWTAIGPTDTNWISIGGFDATGGVAPGVALPGGHNPTILAPAVPGAQVVISDVAAANGTGNGLVWNPNNADGAQELMLNIGPLGNQFNHQWLEDGSYHAPAQVFMHSLHVGDPHVVGQLYVGAGGALFVSAG